MPQTISPWIPVLITGVIFAFGVAVQAAMFAYFVGKTREALTTVQAAVGELKASVQKALEELIGAGQERARFDERIHTLEESTKGLSTVPGAIVRLETLFGAHTSKAEAESARVGRELAGIGRQMGSLATMMASRDRSAPNELPPDQAPGAAA